MDQRQTRARVEDNKTKVTISFMITLKPQFHRFLLSKAIISDFV